MKIHSMILAAVLSVAMMGSAQAQNKQLGGSLLGGALGGYLGSNIGGGSGRLAATAGGAILGLILGNNIGRSLDRADRLYINRSAQSALENAPIGRTTVWRNPDRDVYSTVTPTRTYRRGDGRYCREYQQEITVGGQTQRAYGTACRQPDGSWQVVNGNQSSYQPAQAPVYAPYAPPVTRYYVPSRRSVIIFGTRHYRGRGRGGRYSYDRYGWRR